ncbi:MAG: GNAT family N-acetyltransferase [Ruminococcus sp.]|uniref:GNAT family N-acetyltransferase n=1 Tax=Ruminococcus sp. TaxID=41978 RepID=UPI0025CD7C1A|nr:GNAT family N-acetyltransferase [Ruminococcus sp.]MBR5681751.1 GNAT family N-acetyltransferase [Ruminococcus sp.]
MAVTIEKVSGDTELREVAALAGIIWHECFTDIISSGQIDYMVGKFQSYEAMIKQLTEQHYSYFAVRENEELCGYIGVKPENDDRFFLSKLYLRSDKRGRGIASLMLEKVFSEAKQCGKKKVYLTVNKHNDRAIAVYKKTGFVITDEVVTDIGSGYVMDDYILEYKL